MDGFALPSDVLAEVIAPLVLMVCVPLGGSAIMPLDVLTEVSAPLLVLEVIAVLGVLAVGRVTLEVLAVVPLDVVVVVWPVVEVLDAGCAVVDVLAVVGALVVVLVVVVVVVVVCSLVSRPSAARARSIFSLAAGLLACSSWSSISAPWPFRGALGSNCSGSDADSDSPTGTGGLVLPRAARSCASVAAVLGCADSSASSWGRSAALLKFSTVLPS